MLILTKWRISGHYEFIKNVSIYATTKQYEYFFNSKTITILTKIMNDSIDINIFPEPDILNEFVIIIKKYLNNSNIYATILNENNCSLKKLTEVLLNCCLYYKPNCIYMQIIFDLQ